LGYAWEKRERGRERERETEPYERGRRITGESQHAKEEAQKITEKDAPRCAERKTAITIILHAEVCPTHKCVAILSTLH